METLTIYYSGENVSPPRYQSEQAAGADVYARLDEPVVLKSLERTLVPTGMSMALPPGYEAQIRPRSGLAYKQGLTVLNSPGTIDSDYRGEVRILLINLGREDVIINDGDRIAQMVIASHVQSRFIFKESLEGTERGEGGFGSTGV